MFISANAYPSGDMHLLKAFTLTGKAQGTSYQIIYRAADSLVSASEVNQLFSSVDRALSLYNPESLINRFNRADKEIPTDEHLAAVVQKSLAICAQSKGAFDITIKPLVELWGFGPAGEKKVPSERDIRNALSFVGCGQVYMSGTTLMKKNKEVQIDCNGIAQGYTVDLLAGLLEKKGIQNYLVELGGEIRLLGLNREEMPWSVGIESAEKNELGNNIISGRIRPGQGAVTTSGSYRNSFRKEGKQYSHIINPFTGYPVGNGMISATIIAPDALTADALDNVCMVLGPAASVRFLQNFTNVEAYLVFETPGGKLADTSTMGFGKYLIRKDQD
jgi:thiamine biosynthesis lipoprotein